jgi:adenine phosphoribosyltransferase
MELEKIKGSLKASPIVKMGNYDYFVNPITDGIPRMDPSVLSEVLDGLKEIGDFDCDVIVAPESMGIPIAVPLSLAMGVPYNIIRKKHYGLSGEVSASQVTGYSKSDLYINGISRGDRVTIVDSVVSTGGTLRAVIQGMRSIGAEIVDIVVAVEKGDGKSQLEKEFGIEIKTLVKIELRDSKVEIIG